MKRPRIALWIKWHGNRGVLFGHRGFRLCPGWLWRWAVRRVDRWHEVLNVAIDELATHGTITEIDHSKKEITFE